MRVLIAERSATLVNSGLLPKDPPVNVVVEPTSQWRNPFGQSDEWLIKEREESAAFNMSLAIPRPIHRPDRQGIEREEDPSAFESRPPRNRLVGCRRHRKITSWRPLHEETFGRPSLSQVGLVGDQKREAAILRFDDEIRSSDFTRLTIGKTEFQIGEQFFGVSRIEVEDVGTGRGDADFFQELEIRLFAVAAHPSEVESSFPFSRG